MGHLSKENVFFSALRFLFHLWLLTESSFTRSFHGRHFFSISFGGKTIHGWSFLFWRENKTKENFRNVSRIICTAKRPVTLGLSPSASFSGKTINLLGCCVLAGNHWGALFPGGNFYSLQSRVSSLSCSDWSAAEAVHAKLSER